MPPAARIISPRGETDLPFPPERQLPNRQPLVTVDHQEAQAFLRPEHENVSAEVKEPPSPRMRESRTHRLTIWWFEILSLSAGLGALIAIIVTLAAFDTIEQPTWKYRINLNTLVAILSTFLRVCMLVGVEEGK